MEDILPTVEKLRREKADYNQYQAAQEELDRLSRFVAAHRYVTAQQCALLAWAGAQAGRCALPVGLYMLVHLQWSWISSPMGGQEGCRGAGM